MSAQKQQSQEKVPTLAQQNPQSNNKKSQKKEVSNKDTIGDFSVPYGQSSLEKEQQTAQQIQPSPLQRNTQITQAQYHSKKKTQDSQNRQSGNSDNSNTAVYNQPIRHSKHQPRISDVFKPYRGFDGTQLTEQNDSMKSNNHHENEKMQIDKNDDNDEKEPDTNYNVVVSTCQVVEEEMRKSGYSQIKKNNDIYGLENGKLQQQQANDLNLNGDGQDQQNKKKRQDDFGPPQPMEIDPKDDEEKQQQGYGQHEPMEIDPPINIRSSQKKQQNKRISEAYQNGKQKQKEAKINSQLSESNISGKKQQKDQQFKPIKRTSKSFQHQQEQQKVEVNQQKKESNKEEQKTKKKQNSSKKQVTSSKTSFLKKSSKNSAIVKTRPNKPANSSKQTTKKIPQSENKAALNPRNPSTSKSYKRSVSKSKSKQSVNIQDILPSDHTRGSVMHYVLVKSKSKGSSTEKRQLRQVRRSARVLEKSKKKAMNQDQHEDLSSIKEQRQSGRRSSLKNQDKMKQLTPNRGTKSKSKHQTQRSNFRSGMTSRSKWEEQQYVQVNWIKAHFDQIQITNAFMYEDYKSMNQNDVQITKLLMELQEKQCMDQRLRDSLNQAELNLEAYDQNQDMNQNQQQINQDEEKKQNTFTLVGYVDKEKYQSKNSNKLRKMQNQQPTNQNDTMTHNLASRKASQSQSSQTSMLQRKRIFKETKDKYKIPVQFPLTVEKIISQDINRRGIYALIQLGKLSEFQLGTRYALTPITEIRYARKSQINEVINQSKRMVPEQYSDNIAFVPLNSQLRRIIEGKQKR